MTRHKNTKTDKFDTYAYMDQPEEQLC